MGYYAKICHDCRLEYDSNTKFCSNCGKKFEASDISYIPDGNAPNASDIMYANTSLGTVKYENTENVKDTRKFSTLSIVAIVLAVVGLFCPMPILLIMLFEIAIIVISLVDLIRNNPLEKHFLSGIALALAVLTLIGVYSTDFFYFYK